MTDYTGRFSRLFILYLGTWSQGKWDFLSQWYVIIFSIEVQKRNDKKVNTFVYPYFCANKENKQNYERNLLILKK